MLTCECGRKWELKLHKSIDRDTDTVECTCGRLLKKWSGGHYYTARLVEEIDRKEDNGIAKGST